MQYAIDKGYSVCALCGDTLKEIEDAGSRLAQLLHCGCPSVYCVQHVDAWLKNSTEGKCPRCEVDGKPDHDDFPHSTDHISTEAASVIKDGYFGVGDAFPRFNWERFEVSAVEVKCSFPAVTGRLLCYR